MNFDPRLVQRLTRPLKRPGVTNHRMSEGLLERFQALENRLPLLDQQLNRWSTIVELDAEQVPIVYAQSSKLDNQAVDDLQGAFVGAKQEMRSPISNSVKISKTLTNQDSQQDLKQDSQPHHPNTAQQTSEISISEDLTTDVIVKVIANEVDSPSDVMPIVQQEIPSIPIASSEPVVLAKEDLSINARSVDPVSESISFIPAIASSEQKLSFVQLPQNLDSTLLDRGLPISSEPSLPKTSILRTDRPTEAIQTEQTLTQISDLPQTVIVPISNPPSALTSEPLSFASNISSETSGYQLSPLQTKQINPVNTEQPEITLLSTFQPESSQPLIIQPVSEGIIQARYDNAAPSNIHVSNDSTDVIVKAIATEFDSLSEVMPVVQQEISSNPIASIEASVTPIKAIAQDIAPIMIGAVDMPIIQAQRESGTKVSKESEKQLTTAKSKQTKNKRRSPAPNTVKNTEIAISQTSTHHPNTEKQTSESSILGDLITDVTVKPIATEVDLLSDVMPIVQQEISSSPIASVEASVTPVSAIASSEQKLSFVQLPQNLDSTLLDQGLPIPSEPSLPKISILRTDIPTAAIQTEQPLTQIPNLPQTAIVPISNPPSALLSEPLSFASNISSETSETSEHQLSSLQTKQINPVNTKHLQTTVLSDAQPELSQPLVIQPVSEGVIQARYDNAAPNMINVQPLISTVTDAPTYPLALDAIAPLENLLNLDPNLPDNPIARASWSDSSPEVAEISWASSANPHNPMPIVYADPITSLPSSTVTSIKVSALESPLLIKASKIDVPTSQTSPESLVQRITQESNSFEQKDLEPSTVRPNFTTQNIVSTTGDNDLQTFAQTVYSSQDDLVLTPLNPTTVNENKIVTTSINPKTIKVNNSTPVTDLKKQLTSSSLVTQIVREKVSPSNSLSLIQPPIFPTVQAILETSEQTFEPLLLSRHNSTNSASETMGSHPNQSYPTNSKVITRSDSTITSPTSTSSIQTNASSALSTAQPPAIANHANQNSNAFMKTQNNPEMRETNEINIDLLVAKVERKIIQRLIVEGERRGKRKWL